MEQSTQTKKWAIVLIVVFLIVGLWGYRQQSNQSMFDTMHIAEGLQAGSLLKQASAEFYYQQGKLPSSNEDVGLGEPEVYASNALLSAGITANGVIQLIYDDRTGVANGVVSLIPTVVPGMLKWRCETTDYASIGKYMPQCKYLPEFDSEKIVTEQIKNILPIERHEDRQVITNVETSNNKQCQSLLKPMLLDGIFTRQIVNSSPVDHIQSLGLRQQELYFYSTVVGGAQQTVSHRWLFNNQPIQEQSFTLGFDQFPIWSKQLLNDKKGNWEVQVWADGCLLERFKISHTDNDEAQLVGIDKDNSWHQPKDVLDTIILNSAKSLLPEQDYVVETWMLEGNYWQKERNASGVYSDDITNAIRIGDVSKISGHFNRNRRNQNGDTPLLEAIKNDQEKSAIILLEIGANPFMRGSDGAKPYNLAIERGMGDLTAAMLSYAETEKLWLQGKDERFQSGIIKSILTHQKWQQRNALGDTPLLLAAREDNDWAVAVLLQFQNRTQHQAINPFVNDPLGKRANDIARDNNNLFAADLIEQFQQQSKAPWQILESSISTGMKGARSFDCVIKQPLAKSATYYYFNHVMDIDASVLRHKWFYQNRLVKDVMPNEGSRKGTLFSTHTLKEIDKGYWYVELVNEQGDVLDRMQLAYGEKYTSGGGTPLSTPCLGTKRSLSSLIAGWQDPHLIAEMIDAMDYFDPNNPIGLAEAIEYGNISVVRLLLDRGASLSKPLRMRNKNVPALFLAVKSGNSTMVNYLLHRGADANAQGRGFTTPLYRAVVERNPKIVKLLLENGANPRMPTKYLDSLPLIKAASFCDIDVMELLVKHSARFDQKTSKGLTARDIASRDCRYSEHWQDIEQLVEREAN